MATGAFGVLIVIVPLLVDLERSQDHELVQIHILGDLVPGTVLEERRRNLSINIKVVFVLHAQVNKSIVFFIYI